jgi:retron-type reverse transcriptase
MLTPIFDPTFSDHSFGFRPKRSAHQAVEWARQAIADGRAWAVDVDLDSFFDRVQHDALMGRVARRVHDKQVLALIRAYLEAGVMADGVRQPTEEGTPQGPRSHRCFPISCLTTLTTSSTGVGSASRATPMT